MARPILATKVFAPKPRPGQVTRPRLMERLRLGADSGLTLVSAPAGFGKTTLLAQWLPEASADGPGVAWLSLDPSDGDPATFWTYVVTALATAVPGLGTDALEMLAAGPSAIEPALTAVLNELAAAPHAVWLVLDDYHVVDGPDIAAGMAYLLDHLPPRVHIVISTRADPDLPLSRWRARGELAEVRAADLRFTSGEAAAYLNGAAGLDLAAEEVTALEERTEGWIAALQLAALSLRGRDDVAGFIARFAGDDRYIVDYLVEEVLRHQSGPVRDFLLQSSVLDRLTGPLCDAVTGSDDGSETLMALDRANLFVVALDDRRQWYRYHHLFADVLRARMLAEQPDQLPVLHQRASRWYEHADLTEESVGHALAAGDLDRAIHLMELAVPAIRRYRREAVLLGWLQALPQDAVRRSPVLSVFHAYMSMLAGDLDAVEPWLDDADRALAAVSGATVPQPAGTEDLRTLPATIAVHRASLAQARGDVAGTAEHAQRAFDLAGPTDHLARGSAAGFLGLAAWARGDVPRALETFTQAVASLQLAGNIVDGLSSTVVLADLWLAAGRPGRARQLYERALQVAQAHGDAVARATSDLHVGISEIDCEAGDLVSANRHLAAATALSARAWSPESRYRWFVASARVADAEGDTTGAVGLLDEAERLYRPGFYPNVRPIAAMRARVWIRHGDLSQASEWSRIAGVSATDVASYLGEYDHLTLVRLIIAEHPAQRGSGSLDQAAALLDRLHVAAEASGRGGSVLEIQALRAMLREARGDQPPDALSERELQVLRLLDGELTGPQIARALFVTHNTLRTHTKHIFTKLDVTNRRAAVLRARERGLL